MTMAVRVVLKRSRIRRIAQESIRHRLMTHGRLSAAHLATAAWLAARSRAPVPFSTQRASPTAPWVGIRVRHAFET